MMIMFVWYYYVHLIEYRFLFSLYKIFKLQTQVLNMFIYYYFIYIKYKHFCYDEVSHLTAHGGIAFFPFNKVLR